MQKLVSVLIFFLITVNCNGTMSVKRSMWRINSVSSSGYLFKEGMIVDFPGNKIRLQAGERSSLYPVIVSENRMVIETGYIKWLFEIESNDSVLVLRELYAKTPVVISLTKINNQKNKKS